VEEAGIWAAGMPGSSFFYMLIVPEGRSLEKADEKVRVYNHRVSPNLLQEMRITLLKGRYFTGQDDARHPLVSIVSRSAAEALWPSQDPIGKRFWVSSPKEGWAEVVGVVADVDQRGRVLLDHDFRCDVYFPLFQMRARTASLVLQTHGEAGPTGEQLNDLMRAIDPSIPVYDVKTLQERRREEETGMRLNAFLLIFFASSALLLAVIGIYSILAYTVRQQSFETGVRMAVGADQSDILRYFAWKGAALLGIGLIAGLTFALGVAKAMASILFNVNPHDPLVFILVPCFIALISLPAILQPAYRATRPDPSSLFRRS
jgi:putative ABC transport system permease protein